MEVIVAKSWMPTLPTPTLGSGILLPEPCWWTARMNKVRTGQLFSKSPPVENFRSVDF